MNFDHTDFFAFCHEVINGFFGGIGDGAHSDDDAFGIRRAVVVKVMIFTAGHFGDLGEIVLDNVGNSGVETVGGFLGLEEDIAVLRCPAGDGMFGI